MPNHSEVKQFPYTQAQLFELVEDIEDYPSFLPWCLAVNIGERRENTINANMTVGFKVFRESFSSLVTLNPTSQIDVEYVDGPFRYLNNRWRFKETGHGCEVDFYIDFEFRSSLLRLAAEPVFLEAVKRMVLAFERRAVERFS